MKYDIILSGVGGQGVLSLAAIIATGAKNAGLNVRQSEVHGMAQRGGSVLAHMRISDEEIPGDIIGKGSADMILGMEPMETLRYLEYLKSDGAVVAAGEALVNISDYPDLEKIHQAIKNLPKSVLMDTQSLAKDAGNLKAVNMVMVGAASIFIPFDKKYLIDAISDLFASKGEKIVESNIKAFESGFAAGSRK